MAFRDPPEEFLDMRVRCLMAILEEEFAREGKDKELRLGKLPAKRPSKKLCRRLCTAFVNQEIKRGKTVWTDEPKKRRVLGEWTPEVMQMALDFVGDFRDHFLLNHLRHVPTWESMLHVWDVNGLTGQKELASLFAWLTPGLDSSLRAQMHLHINSRSKKAYRAFTPRDQVPGLDACTLCLIRMLLAGKPLVNPPAEEMVTPPPLEPFVERRGRPRVHPKRIRVPGRGRGRPRKDEQLQHQLERKQRQQRLQQLMQQQETEARVERQEREQRPSGRVRRAVQRNPSSPEPPPSWPEPAPPLEPLCGEDFMGSEHGEKDAGASTLGKKHAGLRRGFLDMLAGESGSDEEEDIMPWRSSPATVPLH